MSYGREGRPVPRDFATAARPRSALQQQGGHVEDRDTHRWGALVEKCEGCGRSERHQISSGGLARLYFGRRWRKKKHHLLPGTTGDRESDALWEKATMKCDAASLVLVPLVGFDMWMHFGGGEYKLTDPMTRLASRALSAKKYTTEAAA